MYPATKKSTQIDLHGWSLTGRGVKGVGCGILVFLGCLNKHAHPEGKNHVKVRAQSCNKSSCPACYMKAAIKEAHRAIHRFVQFDGRPYKYTKHIVASVPKDEYDLDFKDMKTNARRALKEAGVEGGLLIFHPARWNGPSPDDYYYSPHFHVVGHGWVEGTEDVHQLTGWIVHNLGLRKSVVGTISYILSHAGTKGKTHTSTWFGSMSYNKFHSEPEPDYDPLCPYCGNPLVKLRLTRVLGECAGPPFEDGYEGLTDLDCFVVDTRTWRSSKYDYSTYDAYRKSDFDSYDEFVRDVQGSSVHL